MEAALLFVDGRSNESPIYLFSGNEDPVYQQVEGVQLLIERYRQAARCRTIPVLGDE
jgi:hypothetical protein